MKNEFHKQLLIRPFILSDESISGFLYRVSKMNRYRFSYLYNYMHLSIYEAHNNEFNQESLQMLEALVDSENGFINERNGYNLKSFLGADLYTKIIMKNKVKYCPVCIKDNYYHRTSWCLTPFHVCIVHNVMLVDQCPQCRQMISLSAFMNRKCGECSLNFKKIEPEMKDNVLLLLESQKQIQNALWEKDRITIENFNFNFKNFFQLAYCSFHLLIGGIDYTEMSTENLSFFHNQSEGVKSGLKLAIGIANVYWMYLDFPNNFYRVLNDFLKRNPGSQRYERLSAFQKILEELECYKIAEAYNAYFLKQIDDGNVRKDFSVFKRYPNLLEHRGRVRREEVRQKTGIAYEKLHELNDYNELNIETKYTNGQQRYLVEKSKLDSYLCSKQTLISKKEVGLIIEIIPDSVQKIVDAGYLTAMRVANSPNAMYQIEEVNKLVEDCLGVIVEDISASMISFHHVLSKYAKHSFTILEIIAFTLSGQLKPYRVSESRTLADNYYNDAQLKVCMGIIKKRKQEENGFSFNDVMKSLKVGEKRLWKVLREQGIEADYTLIWKDGRKRYYFKEETILRIKAYISKSTEINELNAIEGI
ncbi:TniQ family protein [Paenibacillus roseipurpureus]|uniref:TniQ family protein n=1 Tax=Paenibacillus roseopurpureus TaxID=2918901 RepID=A0AA96LNK0_9BACL|nr:TniQ family protein [Paenibacillus sp. MBLB1832]WNR43003.1 TniQ family protein [Paenibacillus sp. MBLB1832]